MEAVFALIDVLNRQETYLTDVDHRLKRVKLLSGEILQTLTFAKSTVQQDSKVLEVHKSHPTSEAPVQNDAAPTTAAPQLTAGGALLNPRRVMAASKGAPVERQILDALLEVEGAWPFIRSNADIASEACIAAVKQADVARRVADPLLMVLRRGQMEGSYDGVDRVSLQALNSDMAQLDARVIALATTVGALAQDTADAAEIFSSLRGHIAKARASVLSERSLSSMSLLLQAASNLSYLVAEADRLVRQAGGAQLLRPELMQPRTSDAPAAASSSTPSESIAKPPTVDVLTRLKGATSSLMQLKVMMEKQQQSVST